MGKHRIFWLAALLLVALVGGEVGVRASGLVDVPIYQQDAASGYKPITRQHGRFFLRNDWVYNNLGMGTAADFRPVGTLLVGDSETEGSIAFMRQPEKVGPQLQADLGEPVWPMGAKGWALTNELGWLNSHPQVLGIPRIMFLSNSGDFGVAHPWDNQLLHPTHRPLFALGYVTMRRFVRQPPGVDTMPPTPASLAIWRAALHRFLTSYRGHVVFILLPTQVETANHTDGFQPLTAALALEKDSNVSVVRVADDKNWATDLYKNNFHPNPLGNREIAAFVASQLRSEY